MKRVALIDCEDSFTYNIYDYLSQCGIEVDILLHHSCNLENLSIYNGIVLSPGPNTPLDIPILHSIIDKYQREIPLLGVCLGHQAIGMYYGHKLVKSRYPMHGISSKIELESNLIYNGIDVDSFYAMRYNSLCIEDKEDSDLRVIARDNFGEIMGFCHNRFPIYSFQFHPESVGTPQGISLFRNWVTSL